MRRFRTLKLPTGVHPLVLRVYTECNRQQVGIHDLSIRSGVAYDCITAWKQGRMPLVHNLEAVLNVLGFRLIIKSGDRHD